MTRQESPDVTDAWCWLRSGASGTATPVDRGHVLQIGIGVGSVLVSVSLVALLLVPPPLRKLVAALGGVSLVVLAVGICYAPTVLDRFARSRAIGVGPTLFAFTILSLRLTPSLERAADHAADAVGGRLGRSLASHRRSTTDGSRAFQAFAGEWEDLAPSFGRAVSLLRVAVDTPAENRPEILTNALEAVLEGSRERVTEFGAAIRGPAMGIYAFGVMLPLALVGLLPVFGATGSGVSLLLLGAIYDVLLPAGLVLASLWLAAKRPAVAGPSFDRELLERAAPLPQSVAAGLLLAGVSWLGVPLVFPAWTRGIVALGTGGGVVLIISLSPVRTRQEYIETLESGLPDALAIAGRELAEGKPVEVAIATVADRLQGPAGDCFEHAARTRRRLGITVEEAFTGEYGTLSDVPSQRATTASSLLARAGEHGRPGGETVVSVGEYLGRLQQVEREARRELAQTTSTLRQTAVVFAPVIAGVTVALATGMERLEAPGNAIDVSTLGQLVGIYVLLLGIILPTLAVILARGFDPVRIGYRVGAALLTAGVLYPVAFLAARTLVYV